MTEVVQMDADLLGWMQNKVEVSAVLVGLEIMLISQERWLRKEGKTDIYAYLSTYDFVSRPLTC